MNEVPTPAEPIADTTASVHQYREMVDALYKAFDHFNGYYKLELPKPIITIASVGRKRAYGWFWRDRWAVAGGKDAQTVDEINIGAEHAARGADEVLETLIHEMAHSKNRHEGLKDCNASQYHNKLFKVMAERLGLIVEKSKRFGWGHTKLGDDAKKAIGSLPFDKNVFNCSRLGTSSGGKESPYITVALKKETYADIIKELIEHYELETPTELVKNLLDIAWTKVRADQREAEQQS